LINKYPSLRKLEEEGKCVGLSKFQSFLGSSSVELEIINDPYPYILQASNNTGAWYFLYI
jgi:hypothetical protein